MSSLTAKTNRVIGGRAPSFYLERLAGITAREQELLELIGAAMGKPAQLD